MLYNLVNIAWGMWAYSRSLKSPSCFRWKPCGKHALNVTRGCMYNVAHIRSWRPRNIRTLIWCSLKPAEGNALDLKPMRLMERSEMMWAHEEGNDDASLDPHLSFVANERRNETIVWVGWWGSGCVGDLVCHIEHTSHCACLHWHQQQSLVSDLLDSQGN